MDQFIHCAKCSADSGELLMLACAHDICVDCASWRLASEMKISNNMNNITCEICTLRTPIPQSTIIQLRKQVFHYVQINKKKQRQNAEKAKLQEQSREVDLKNKKIGMKGGQFFQFLKKNGVRDQIIQLLGKQEVQSMEILKSCTQQMLLQIGIPLGQVILIKKIEKI